MKRFILINLRECNGGGSNEVHYIVTDANGTCESAFRQFVENLIDINDEEELETYNEEISCCPIEVGELTLDDVSKELNMEAFFEYEV